MSALLFFKKELSNLMQKEEDTFNDTEKTNTVDAILGALMIVVNLAIFSYAIFLSFKRNKGFNLLSFLGACCCSLCYIVYALAVPMK